MSAAQQEDVSSIQAQSALDREIFEAFRPGEVVDEAQIEELRRWRLRDFRDEPDDRYVSDAPVGIVCGCGRSGTTLVRVMLDSHPELCAGPESLLFLPVPINSAELARKFALDRAELDRTVAGSGSRAQVIERCQELIKRRAGKLLWVDKTARNVHRLDYILRHFPRARVIHVVRDPRDVVASLKTHRKRKVVDGVVVPTGYCMPVELCIERWERAVQDAEAHESDERVRVMRYEDVVREPMRTVRHLCDFLKVEFDSAMLEFHRIERDPLQFPQNIEATRPISPASIGRHRTTLTAEEMEQVEERLGGPMGRYGYVAWRPPPRRTTLPVGLATASELQVIPSARVHELLADDPLQVKAWTLESLRAHHERRFLQPPKSYLVTSDNPYDRVISLPAAIQGPEPAIGLKWIGSHSKNTGRGSQRAHAVIVLNDPVTHAARVVMDGTLISTLRTLAVSLIAMDQFAARPLSVGILGMGRLGRMHALLLGELYPSIETIACFSRRAPFDDLLGGARVRRCGSPQDVLAHSEVVITCSAATSPYIGEADVGRKCRLIVNLSLMDCEVDVIAGSDHIVVDDWELNLRAQRVFRDGVEQGRYGRDRVQELGTVLFGPRRAYPGRVFVNPLGMGLEDVHVAAQIARRLGYYP